MPSKTGTLVPLSSLYSLRTVQYAARRESSGTVSFRHYFVQPGARCLARRSHAVDRSGQRAIGIYPPPFTPASRERPQAFQDSLSSEPILILAALADRLYRARAYSTRAYIHPITILSTLPSAGVGALLALLLTRNDSTSSH